jgi:hypothetical protein
MRFHAPLAFALLLMTVLGGCTSSRATISPERSDFVVVEGRVDLRHWDCGTVPRDGGGYFYVCDMPIDVQRVVLGREQSARVTARFFADVMEVQDEVYLGPDWTRDRRAAAILWRRGDEVGSYVLSPFPGRWCVPVWMIEQFDVTPEEVARLDSAGYPECTRVSFGR